MGYFDDDDLAFKEDIGLLSETSSHLTRLQKIKVFLSAHIYRLRHGHSYKSFLGFLRVMALATLRFFVPSFLTKSSNAEATNKLAVIDGLRGIACLLVFNTHLMIILLSYLTWSGSWNGHHLLYQLPFFRLMCAGKSMVYIFWTIAGYTASLKPLSQLRKSETAGFHKSLSSSLVRRGFRLYLPPFASTMLIGAMIGTGMLTPAWNVRYSKIHDQVNFYQLAEELAQKRAGVFGQTWIALQAGMSMLNIFETHTDTSPKFYDSHLWCISIQYRMTLMVTLGLLAASRMTHRYRTPFLGALMLYSIFVSKKGEMTTHFAGVFLAEIDTRAAANKQTLPSGAEKLDRPGRRWNRPIFRRFAYSAVFILGCFLASAANAQVDTQLIIGSMIKKSPYFFNTLLGGNDNYIAIGAVLLTYGVIHCELVHKLFNSRIALYLGKISYSMYLVHGVVLKLTVWSLLPQLYKMVGTAGPASHHSVTGGQLFAIWSVATLISLPVTVWLSDVFFRGVEMQASKLEFLVDRKVSS